MVRSIGLFGKGSWVLYRDARRAQGTEAFRFAFSMAVDFSSTFFTSYRRMFSPRGGFRHLHDKTKYTNMPRIDGLTSSTWPQRRTDTFPFAVAPLQLIVPTHPRSPHWPRSSAHPHLASSALRDWYARAALLLPLEAAEIDDIM
jgi:hypothetical protein